MFSLRKIARKGLTACLQPQFTERALAKHLLSPLGGPSAEYHIALAQLKLQKNQLTEAEDSLNEALSYDHQVISVYTATK